MALQIQENNLLSAAVSADPLTLFSWFIQSA